MKIRKIVAIFFVAVFFTSINTIRAAEARAPLKAVFKTASAGAKVSVAARSYKIASANRISASAGSFARTPTKALSPSMLHTRGLKPPANSRLRPEYTIPSKHTNVTRQQARQTNIKINQNRENFEAKLQSRGFTQSAHPDGLTIYQKNSTQYTVRPSAKSTNTPTANRSVGSTQNQTHKFRLN